MAADVEMTGVEPITADSDLPPPSIVEQWTPEELFGFAPIPKILWNDEVRATFCTAGISGTVFLQCGGDRRFWMGECQLPVGSSVELEGLARRIKNMGKEKSQVQSPPAPSHAVLPTPSSVEQWTEKELLDCILVKEILADGEVRAKFKEVKIDGKAFLLRGDDLHFWTDVCHLPPGPSAKLEDLAERIKNMGKEESRVESPSLPRLWTVEIARLELLHGLLWGKWDSLRDTVFGEFEYPSWNRDTNSHIAGDMRTAVKLSLSGIISGAQLKGPYCLPCEANELLVRGAYLEMYNILLEAQEDRLKDLQEGEAIPHSKKIILILGQPGIGKTWFLTYVLVRRLLEGKPTIFQLADFQSDNNPNATHYLVDRNGVRQMDSSSFDELFNPNIWVLADQKPVGVPRRAGGHSWLVVVTSSPREDNYHYLVKQYSPEKFYLPAWEWEEVVAAAALKGLSQKMWNKLCTCFGNYGPIPRLLFQGLFPPRKYATGEVGDATEVVGDATGEDGSSLKRRITAYELVLNQKILDLLGLEPDIALSAKQYGVNSCDAIVLVRPRKMKWYKYVSDLPVFDIATSYICQKIASATVDKSLEAARKMYEFLLGQAETKTSAGWIFEGRMHILFQHHGPFKATKLGGSKTVAIDMSHKPCKDFSNLSELGSMLRKGPGSQSIDPANIGVYFKPEHCNFCAVDSLAITTDAKTNKPLLVLFQMTVSTSYPVEAHGLASIWKEIPAELKKIPAILVFVVPVDAASKFSKQTIVPSTSNFDKWEQYVLPVSAETLWKNTALDCEVSAS